MVLGLFLTFPLFTNFHPLTHIEFVAELFKLSSTKTFCRWIHNLIICLDILHFNFILQDLFSDEVIVHLHVPSSCMEDYHNTTVLCNILAGVGPSSTALAKYFLELSFLPLFTMLLWLIVIQLVVSYYTKKLLQS